MLLAFGLLLFVLVGLALLAKPMLQVKPEADAARDELAAAQDAIQAEDLPTAKAHVAAARVHVQEASDRVNGFGGDVWRWVPIAGGAVKDVRHLVGALDQATSLAEIGTEVYPDLMQSDTLVQNATVDLEQLDEILTALNRAGQHLHAASEDLDAVNGNTPLIGDKVLDARDAARERIEPLRATYDDAEPVLDALPDVLGADGESTYIVAIMNPAELRYSGGATLTLVPMTMTDGKIEFGGTLTNEDVSAGAEKIKWPKVKGNPFHSPGKTRVVNATFSPYWSQSGEELLRAWEVRYGQKADGVIAVDLQALARLMDLTGPVQAPGVGELNSTNLVKVLAGSYDTYDTVEQRKAINEAVVPAFREKLFQGGQFAEKFQVLATAAKGRHFAMYFRDPRLQDAFVKRGLSGDLSDTEHDYLGVFTQNLNSSKADYWQTRIVDSDVKLNADGSADVDLTVTVQNPSPPWVHADVPDPSQDPRFGYYTRWAGNSIAVFLPRRRGGPRPGDHPQQAVQAHRAAGARPVVLQPQGDARARRPGGPQGDLPSAGRRDGRRRQPRLRPRHRHAVHGRADGYRRHPAPAEGLRPERAPCRLGDGRRPDAEVRRWRPRRAPSLRGEPLEAVTPLVRSAGRGGRAATVSSLVEEVAQRPSRDPATEHTARSPPGLRDAATETARSPTRFRRADAPPQPAGTLVEEVAQRPSRDPATEHTARSPPGLRDGADAPPQPAETLVDERRASLTPGRGRPPAATPRPGSSRPRRRGRGPGGRRAPASRPPYDATRSATQAPGRGRHAPSSA